MAQTDNEKNEKNLLILTSLMDENRMLGIVDFYLNRFLSNFVLMLVFASFY